MDTEAVVSSFGLEMSCTVGDLGNSRRSNSYSPFELVLLWVIEVGLDGNKRHLVLVPSALHPRLTRASTVEASMVKVTIEKASTLKALAVGRLMNY